MTTETKYGFRYFTYIEPVLRSPVIKTYGTTIFTIFALIIFIFFAIKPTVETILVLQKKLSNSQEVYRKITEKSENLTQARKNYQSLDTNAKAKIQSSIPNKTDLKTLIQSLEAVALLNQASISAIQIQPLTLSTEDNQNFKHRELSEIAFTLNLEGNYDNLLSFVKQLKTTNRLITIENLAINRSQDGKTILLSINGKGYYLK